MGRVERKGEGCRLVGKPGRRILRNGKQRGPPEASGVAENPVGDCQGVGFKSPRCTDTHGVEELPQELKKPGVTPEGNRVPGTDGQGLGGDGNSPATQDTEGIMNNSRRDKMVSGQETAAPQILQWGTAESGRGEVRMYRNPNGADGARPEHGTLARHKYGLLVEEEPEGDPAATEPQGSGEIPEETLKTGFADERTVGMAERNEQRALLACGQPEDKAEERAPPQMAAHA